MANANPFVDALHEGDPAKVAALIAEGANVRYKDEHGYDALIDAVHGRDVTRDPRLLDLLKLLVANGVDLNGGSKYNESALRTLSDRGRFDAVRLLLDAGTDEGLLKWKPLIAAVALGSLTEVEELIAGGAPLEEVDGSLRTAWHVSLLGGDLAKAKLLRARGANVNARGVCDHSPLQYAVEGHHPEIVRWLLESGHDANQRDEFGNTALLTAVESGDLECVDLLLAAGAMLGDGMEGTLANAKTRPMVQRLLAAGADAGDLSNEGRRALIGLPPDPDAALIGASPDDYQRARTRFFGDANPTRMNEPFWLGMIRAGVNGYQGRQRFSEASRINRMPVWCAQRFGQSLTILPDGRIVQIAGEHEDYYDPDFCIYNDVFVHEPEGTITIYGYPEGVFPPTDFHTATLIGEDIYVIGSLGYQGTRRYGETPIYRLSTRTFAFERLEASGDAPGWISRHRADLISPKEIRVSKGKLAMPGNPKELYDENVDTFTLDVERLCWRREA